MLLFSSAYNEYTVISKEYTGPLDFDITGVDCNMNNNNSLCVEICNLSSRLQLSKLNLVF